jgi:hypothetical protein
VAEVDELLQRYHHARGAAEAKEAERDSIALVNVPLDHPRHLDRQDPQTRLAWTRLDAEMWERRQRASEAWSAYCDAVLRSSCSA